MVRSPLFASSWSWCPIQGYPDPVPVHLIDIALTLRVIMLTMAFVLPASARFKCALLP
jgi:hypothetical protein